MTERQVKVLAKPIFGEKLIFGEPDKRPKGWYVKKAKEYIGQFLKAIKEGTCTTGMAKIPTNPIATEKDMKGMYNAIKSLRRRKKAPVDVAIIESDLWLIFEGKN